LWQARYLKTSWTHRRQTKSFHLTPLQYPQIKLAQLVMVPPDWGVASHRPRNSRLWRGWTKTWQGKITKWDCGRFYWIYANPDKRHAGKHGGRKNEW